jgi:hypothetical protein
MSWTVPGRGFGFDLEFIMSGRLITSPPAILIELSRPFLYFHQGDPLIVPEEAMGGEELVPIQDGSASASNV